MSICAYTSVCQDDACWVGKYLAEVERLDIPFAIHLDRCLPMTKAFITSHKMCVGFTETYSNAGEFNETHKQGVFDLIHREGFDIALAWDIDETWEKDAKAKLLAIEKMDCEYVDCRWVNLWDDDRHMRTDGVFGGGHRVKTYKLDVGYSWKFKHPITNGPSPCMRNPKYKNRMGKSDLVCLHWGMMTQELRELHKERWDRIYTKAVGANPYGFWNYALDPTITPVIQEHNYL